MMSIAFLPRFTHSAILASLFVVAPVLTNATVYFVDAAQPNDTGNGLSWPTAMQKIQTAIDSSAVGDTVLVKYGTYTITTDLVITSDRKITSDDGTNDSWYSAAYSDSLCLIDAGASGRVLTITGSDVTEATWIRGLKMTGGRATGESPGAAYGGGVFIGGGADPKFW
ncbi:MAG: hypothetical protein JSW50_11990, partial [Candidatus Latescibacterota bacterium]